MQVNLLWTGREYYSLENCLLTINADGAEVNSVIIGQYENKIYRADYQLNTDQDWRAIFFELRVRHDNNTMHIVLEGDGKGNWLYNGNPAKEFDGCIDVDLPLTPFTNTLPIRRLKLKNGEEKQVSVIYCDVLVKEIKAVKQIYRRISEDKYHYENVPNDFEADIQVDETGLVIDYPSLFVRTAKLETNYQ